MHVCLPRFYICAYIYVYLHLHVYICRYERYKYRGGGPPPRHACLYVPTYMYACVGVHACTSMKPRPTSVIYMYIHISAHACIYIDMNVTYHGAGDPPRHMCKCTYIYMHTCMCVYVYEAGAPSQLHMCIYKCIYICVHIRMTPVCMYMNDTYYEARSCCCSQTRTLKATIASAMNFSTAPCNRSSLPSSPPMLHCCLAALPILQESLLSGLY